MRRYIIVLVLLLLLTAGYNQINKHTPISDSQEYAYCAANLLNHNTLYSGDLQSDIDYRLYAKRPPAYSLFILLQHENPLIIRASQILLTLLLFLVGLLILRTFSLKRSSIIAFGLFFIGSLVLYIHAAMVLADLFLAAIISAALALYLDNRVSPFTKEKLLFILWGIALFVKPIMLPSMILWPFIVIYFILAKNKKWNLHSFWPIIILVFTSYINQQNTSVWEYNSMSTINMVQYNARLTIAKQYGYDSAQQFAKNKSFIIPRNKKEYVVYKEMAGKVSRNAVLNNFDAYVKIQILGMLKMVIDPGRFELYTYFGEPTADISLTEMVMGGNWKQANKTLQTNIYLVILLLGFTFIGCVKLVCFLFSYNSLKKALSIIFVIAYFMVITGPVGAARLFLPVIVPYLVLASIGLTQLFNFFQKSSKC